MNEMDMFSTVIFFIALITLGIPLTFTLFDKAYHLYCSDKMYQSTLNNEPEPEDLYHPIRGKVEVLFQAAENNGKPGRIHMERIKDEFGEMEVIFIPFSFVKTPDEKKTYLVFFTPVNATTSFYICHSTRKIAKEKMIKRLQLEMSNSREKENIPRELRNIQSRATIALKQAT